MKIGDTITLTNRIIKSEVTYTDAEKSCGYVKVLPDLEGTILGFKSGWMFSYWIVGLNSGQIIKVRA